MRTHYQLFWFCTFDVTSVLKCESTVGHPDALALLHWCQRHFFYSKNQKFPYFLFWMQLRLVSARWKGKARGHQVTSVKNEELMNGSLYALPRYWNSILITIPLRILCKRSNSKDERAKQVTSHAAPDDSGYGFPPCSVLHIVFDF
jgi:hypothetical protein